MDAVISDIHGNLEALNAVLEAVDRAFIVIKVFRDGSVTAAIRLQLFCYKQAVILLRVHRTPNLLRMPGQARTFAVTNGLKSANRLG